MKWSLLVVLSMGFLLSLPIEAASGAACVEPRIPRDPSVPGLPDFPFFGMGFSEEKPTQVTVFMNADLRAVSGSAVAAQRGIDTWSSSCAAIPLPIGISLNSTQERPLVLNRNSPAWATTFLIELLRNEPAPVEGTNLIFSEWQSSLNRSVVYGRCPEDPPRGSRICPRPNIPINWAANKELLETVVAHELGHAFGLAHDRNESGCNSTLMHAVPSIGSKPWAGHCRAIRILNNNEEACNNLTRGANEPHPCQDRIRERPSIERPDGGPGGRGRGDSVAFCDSYPTACGGDNPWDGSGIHCDWTCVRWADSAGATGGSCNWNCAAAPLLTEGEAIGGNGPVLGLLNVAEGDVLSSLVTVEGFAMEYFGGASAQLFLDGAAIPVISSQQHFPEPAACSAPLGVPGPDCNLASGFRAQFDSRDFSNGPHVLAMVGTDSRGHLSSIEVPIVINNSGCGDSQPPSVALTAPVAEAVGGMVLVAATASDDHQVARVEILVDGVRRAQLLASPFRYNWDTSTSSLGNHRLAVQAFDGCGNASSRVERWVIVDNRQSPYRGTAVMLPGRIEAEEYDLGLHGVSHSDSTAGNAGGQLRNNDVDLGVSAGQFAVGWITPGEWLEFTVASSVASTYRLKARQASPAGGSFRLSIDGGGAAQTFNLPATGGFTQWSESALAGSVPIAAGQQVLRLEALSAGFNLDWLELLPAAPSCVESSLQGCLQGNRFAVTATIDGQPATRQATVGDVVYFQVFDPHNIEMALKVLDGRPTDGHFWVYHGSLTALPYQVRVVDTVTGEAHTYLKTSSDLCGGFDTRSFFNSIQPAAGSSAATSACADGSTAICLFGGRYRVEVIRQGIPQAGARITGQTAAFSFFSASNAEVVVKILDGSAINQHIWVFFGSLTNQAYEVRVTDTATGIQRIYPSGSGILWAGRLRRLLRISTYSFCRSK